MQTEYATLSAHHTYPLTDSHCHLQLLHTQDPHSFEELVQQSHTHDMLLIDVGITPTDFTERKTLCSTMTQICHSVGLHPLHTTHYTAEQLYDELRALIPHAIAIGETGLDGHHIHVSPSHQKMCFETHIMLAKEYRMPLIIHSREAIDDILDMIEHAQLHAHEYGTGVMHCFSGTVEQAMRSMDLGLYISFGATISYTSAQQLRDVVAAIPDNYILTETDSPYLLHKEVQKLQKKKKSNLSFSRINTPLHLPFLYTTICDIRHTSRDTFATLVRNNCKKLFKT